MTLTKADLAEQLANATGLTAREAKALVEVFFQEIVAALEANDEVKLNNFGVFNTLQKAARQGRNPKTGREVPISARRVVTFRPSSRLRDTAQG